MKNPPLLAALSMASLLALSGCNYDVPVTLEPTRPVEKGILGDWVRYNQDDQRIESLSVHKFDDSHYVGALDGCFFRGFHTDHARLPLVSLQGLNSDSRKYVYYVWRLSPDSSRLTIQGVQTAVIPVDAKDTATVQRLLTEHASDPKLLSEEIVYTRKKSN